MAEDPHVLRGGIFTRQTYTVTALPPASANAGEILHVTDQTFGPNSYGSIPTGGGTFRARVRSDGSNWRVETFAE